MLCRWLELTDVVECSSGTRAEMSVMPINAMRCFHSLMRDLEKTNFSVETLSTTVSNRNNLSIAGGIQLTIHFPKFGGTNSSFVVH